MNDDQVLPSKIWAGADRAKIPISLETDKFIVDRINDSRYPKFVHTQHSVQLVTRRAMEVAFYEAVRATRERPGPIANDIGRGEALGKKSESALDEYIKWLEPSATCADDLRLSILTTQAGFYGDSLQESSALWLHLQASDDAQSLWRARGVLRDLNAAARRKLAGMVTKGYENASKPDRTAFLRVMAEAWIYLMKKRPGIGQYRARNPFLRFTEAAWEDVFGPDANPDGKAEFIGALQHLPSWSDAELDQLKRIGPYWLGLFFNSFRLFKNKP